MQLLIILVVGIGRSMLNEHIHRELAEIYDEFDRHSRITNTDYSIDADYPQYQGYTILKCPDFNGFIRHIANHVKNRPVDFRVNGNEVDYHQIGQLPQRRHNIVTFAVTPIQEEDEMSKEDKKKDETEDEEIMGENQYKYADTKHARDQNPRLNSKYAHKKSAFEEANLKFDDRLKTVLDESISFTEPEILFTQTTHAIEPNEDETEELEGLKEELTQQIQKYMSLLDSTNNEITIAIAEDIIESCTSRIKQIDEVLSD